MGAQGKCQAIVQTMERFVIPLVKDVPQQKESNQSNNSKQTRSLSASHGLRQVSNNHRLTQLIAVTSTKSMIDFMSDLFNAVNETIYPKYAMVELNWLPGKRMSYDNFMDFAKDYEIFPSFCS